MLLYTGGSVDALVVMYAINVFVTFALSQLAMIKYWRRPETRKRHSEWRRPLAIAVICFVVCSFILVVNLFEKFAEGAWVTVIVTGALVALCMLIKRHYSGVFARLKASIRSSPPPDQLAAKSPPAAEEEAHRGAPGGKLLRARDPLALDGDQALSPLLRQRRLHVGRRGGQRHVPGRGRSGSGAGRDEEALKKYVDLARGMGIPADQKMSMGTRR